MKKILLLGIAIITTLFFANAQYKLSSASNAFVVGDKHEFVFTSNMGEGISGKDVIWDFTGLQKTEKTLTTNMLASSDIEKAALIPQANLVIEEAGNFFFFKVTKDGMEQYGAANGCSVTRFDKPMGKLKFPFKYADVVSGDFSGVLIAQDNREHKMAGKYEIVADAYGTLLLPGNVTVKNATRIKQTRTFDNSDLKEITYRWYASGVRYPVLVVIKFESAQKSYIAQTALYAHMGNSELNDIKVSDNAAKLNISSVEVFPNPFKTTFSIRYKLEKSGNVKIDLLEASGKVVKACIDQRMEAGYNSTTVEVDKDKVGTYFIRFAAGEDVVVKKIIQN